MALQDVGRCDACTYFSRQCPAAEHTCHHRSTRPAHLTKSRLKDRTALSEKEAVLILTHLQYYCRDDMDAVKIYKELEARESTFPKHVLCTRLEQVQQGFRQGVLTATLLQDPYDLGEKYDVGRDETEGHKAARRNEQLLQLFMYLHVLASNDIGKLRAPCAIAAWQL